MGYGAREGVAAAERAGRASDFRYEKNGGLSRRYFASSAEGSVVLLHPKTGPDVIAFNAGIRGKPVKQAKQDEDCRKCEYDPPDHYDVLLPGERIPKILEEAYWRESAATRLKPGLSHRVVIT